MEIDAENKKEKKSGKVLRIIGWIATIAQIAFSAAAAVLLLQADLLPGKWLALVFIVLAALILVCRLLMKRKIRKVRFFIGLIVSVFVSVVLAMACSALHSLTSTLQTITDATVETSSMSVYVRADDEAESIEDAKDYPFGIMETLSREDTDQAVSMIEEEVGQTLNIEEYDGIVDLADAILSGGCDAMIINSDFVDMMTEIEGYEDFDEEVKEIASYDWTEEVAEEETEEVIDAEDVELDEDVFVMYISGIDKWGAISTKSRSDVNILAVVNTNTRQVLLVNTPRDYYVELSISGGEKDKLTHAGIYGIDVSVDTMEMLYDTDIDYYFRLNFSGFEALIDALGGITVESDVAFDVDPDYHFVVGENELDGLEALAFARERYSFSDGDRQRGKNQMAVIEGVIDKLTSTAVLTNFDEILDGLEGSFETDLPYSELSGLVKQQLAEGGSWDVVTYSVDGTGDRASTYSLSSSVYVMVPDEETVDTAKELINDVLAGETVSVEEE